MKPKQTDRQTMRQREGGERAKERERGEGGRERERERERERVEGMERGGKKRKSSYVNFDSDGSLLLVLSGERRYAEIERCS